MAKKNKSEKLLPDKVVADNIELIRHIGHTATHTEIADAKYMFLMMILLAC